METATNPKTGERVYYDRASGRWLPLKHSAAAAGAAGVNRGVAKVLGLPVDALAGAARAAGLYEGERPVGGSESILQGMNLLGVGHESEQHPFAQRVGEEIGAGMVPAAGMLGAAGRASMTGAGMMSNIARHPLGFSGGEMAASGAGGVGAAAAEEYYPGNPYMELAGQTLPGMAPAMAHAGLRGLLAGPEMAGNLENATRAGVSPTLGQVSGRESVQGLENVVAKAPGGVGVMRRALTETADQLGRKVDDMTGSLTTRATAEDAGRAVQRGIKDFVGKFRQRSETLYSKLDQYIEPDVPVSVSNTKRALTELTAPIEGARALSEVLANPKLRSIAQAFEADIANGQLPYRALKELRSTVGRQLSSPELVSDAPRAAMKQLYGAMSDDMADAARRAGGKAPNVLSRANKFYKSGMKRIDDHLERLAKQANPEDVFRLATKGKEGGSGIRAIRRSIPAEDWDVVAGTVLKRMGRARPGHQDELGEVFSPETFLTNWNSLSPQAKEAIFGGTRYRSLGKDLKALTATAARMRESGRVLANPSGTSGQLLNSAALGTGGAALYAGDLMIPALIGGTAATTAGTATLMTSPGFVRWLAGTSRIPVEKLPGYLGRIGAALEGEPEDVIEDARAFIESLNQE